MARRRLSVDTPLLPLSPTFEPIVTSSPNLSRGRYESTTSAPCTPQSPTYTDCTEDSESEKLLIGDGSVDGYRLLSAGASSRDTPQRALFGTGGARYLLPFAIAAVCALVSAAIFYRESAQTVWSNVAYELGGDSVQSGCGSAEVLGMRREAEFWVAEVGSRYVTVHPRDRRRFANCEDLTNAFFTVRLHYASEVRLLEDPIQTSMGVYQFALLPPVTPQSSPATSAEVVLDMDFLPGGKAGMPCGLAECNYTSLMDSGMDWRGVQVMDQEGEVPTWKSSRSTLSTSDVELPFCTALDYLAGSWSPETSHFTFVDPTSPSTPCRPHPITPPSPSSPRRWIRFLGDSNTRKLLPTYATLLGLNNSLAYKPETDAHPTVLMAWNDNLILTFSWWFMRQNVPLDEMQDEEQLEGLLAYSLSDFLDSVPWDRTKPYPSHFEGFEDAAHRIYLSIGSHAPQATTLGVKLLLAKLEPLVDKVRQAGSKVIINLTSATAPSRLPKLYVPTKVLRNNVMLKATNRVIAEWAKGLGLTVIDLFTLTRTMGPENMKDPVHFGPRVYEIFAGLVYSEWVMGLESERRAQEERVVER